MFCRHNRLEATCPICSRKPSVGGEASGGVARRPSRPARAPSDKRRRPSAGRGASTLSVRRMARAADDGYEHELLPGLRATEDAARLADELAFAEARLHELRDAPPGLYAEVAAAEDPEEAAWLAFQIALLSPLEDDDPWAGIAAARTAWATGELPATRRRARAARAPRRATVPPRPTARGSAARDPRRPRSPPSRRGRPQRRFDRAYERLSLPGFGRARATSCWCCWAGWASSTCAPRRWRSPASRPTRPSRRPSASSASATRCSWAARASALATEVGVTLEALDLGLRNFGAATPADRVTAGATVEADPERAAAIRAVLGAG